MNEKRKASGAEKSVAAIIETPRGSRNKLKYDPDKRMYKLSKVMPEGMVFPYDFGFEPERRPKTATRRISWC
jgi:inorganic pyrophosphatase